MSWFYIFCQCLSSEIVRHSHDALIVVVFLSCLQHWDDFGEVRRFLSREIYKKADLCG